MQEAAANDESGELRPQNAANEGHEGDEVEQRRELPRRKPVAQDPKEGTDPET